MRYIETKRPPQHTAAEDEKNPWYHLNLPHSAVSQILTDLQRNIGRTRLSLPASACSGKPLRKEFGTVPRTAFHQPAAL